MFNTLKQLFNKEETNLPNLPIKETRNLSKVEIEYIINELNQKQINLMNDIENNNKIIVNESDIEFSKLITNRIINNLKYKIPFLEIELIYLNGVLRGKKNMRINFRLFHQVKESDTTEITDLIFNQGYSFVPTVGYLKIG